jgi:triosephosphate isomerase
MNNDKKYIVGNWKMNGSYEFLKSWIDDIFNSAKKFGKIIDNQIVLCPPSVLLGYANELAKKHNAEYQNLHLRIGAQDCHHEESGAYTGDVNASLIAESGTEFVIVGHSERRANYNESDEIVRKKVNAVIKAGMMPIVCVGEDDKTREAGHEFRFIDEQISASIPEGVDFEKLIIAYEPIWAIGNGKSADYGDIEDMIKHIKNTVAKNRNIDHNIVTILYGGSVTATNSKKISQINEVDGFLVGGASLDSRKFFEIILNTL